MRSLTAAVGKNVDYVLAAHSYTYIDIIAVIDSEIQMVRQEMELYDHVVECM